MTKLSREYNVILKEKHHTRMAKVKDIGLGLLAGGVYLLVIWMLTLWRW
mgnify:FL=1